MLKPEERRSQLLEKMGANKMITATELSKELGVSRQIIVSDIAILRERGYGIVATPRGYRMTAKKEYGFIDALTCRHGSEDILKEFYIIVDNGGTVLDISVDHLVYGMLSAGLYVRSRHDADEFMNRMIDSSSKPMSELTKGIHIHRIGTGSPEDFDRIAMKLNEAGLLYNEEG